VSIVSIIRTIGSLVVERPSRSKVFERFGLDYCCGGHLSLEEACAKAGVHLAEVVRALAEFDAASPADEAAPWSQDLAALADHIEATHHAYLHAELSRMSGLVEKVAKAHGETDPRLIRLTQVFERFREEMELHMAKEEQILFPLIRRMVQGESAASFHCGSVRGPVSMMRHEHDEHAVNLGLIKELTENFAVPDYACNTYRAMLAALQELERDLHRHIHKENNILFPGVEALEG
jgi:regulator of cell morphogenesis and NO signaling